MSELVLTERNGPVGVLTLNRPERHNSLVPPLLSELLGALDGLKGPPDVRALVLQANGRSFSTGGDVRAFHERAGDLEAYSREIVGLLNQTVLAMIAFPIPIVAAVHGIVTGGSLGLVLASDIVLVSPEASFTPYYSVVGFSPDGGWTALLPDVIGRRRAAEVLILNRTIGAEQAVAWGLASRIIPADRIRQEALETAAAIAAMKPGSIRRTKRLLSSRGSCAERLEAERRAFVEQIASVEAEQGLIDFVARRGAAK
jgi:2-(1,2-epoxy-1,2-dihydrophenyl)acetyl-CoA isomerase